jgi:uncharacterized protein YqjF (DUF2071 family)
MRQRWSELLFLHWEVEPHAVADTLPAGLEVDTFGGRAYLGIVPFLMQRVRPRGLPPLPGLSWFGELNLRTYVRGPDGVPGVWFYSLDADQRLAVWLARRFFALPYHRASISAVRQGAQLDYHWSRARRTEPDPAFRYRTPPASAGALHEATPGTLEHFLVERYVLYSRRPLFVPGPDSAGPPPADRDSGLYAGRVEHPPYRVSPAELERWNTQLLQLNGLPHVDPATPPMSVLWSPRVDVAVYPLRRVT